MNTPNAFNPDATFLALEEAAEERSNAEYEADLLEKQGEVLLADLMKKEKAGGTPATLCKNFARTRPEWKVHYEGECAARQKKNRTWSRYNNLMVLAKHRQSEETSRRSLAG